MKRLKVGLNIIFKVAAVKSFSSTNNGKVYICIYVCIYINIYGKMEKGESRIIGQHSWRPNLWKAPYFSPTYSLKAFWFWVLTLTFPQKINISRWEHGAKISKMAMCPHIHTCEYVANAVRKWIRKKKLK